MKSAICFPARRRFSPRRQLRGVAMVRTRVTPALRDWRDGVEPTVDRDDSGEPGTAEFCSKSHLRQIELVPRWRALQRLSGPRERGELPWMWCAKTAKRNPFDHDQMSRPK